MVAEADVSICVVLMIPCQTEANASYFCPRASATFLGERKLTDFFSEGGLFSSVSLESKMREKYLARKKRQGFFLAAQAGNN